MTTHTKRDWVWTTALEEATTADEFSVQDIQTACGRQAPSERTVRDVLTTMADQDWLAKTINPSNGVRRYTTGTKLDAITE